VKLLAKLYEPAGGQILVDDASLHEISASDWRSRVSGAFQDLCRFEFTVQNSIGVGDLP
jgi:ATP-binding cassette, subfamily B, bacterial